MIVLVVRNFFNMIQNNSIVMDTLFLHRRMKRIFVSSNSFNVDFKISSLISFNNFSYFSSLDFFSVVSSNDGISVIVMIFYFITSLKKYTAVIIQSSIKVLELGKLINFSSIYLVTVLFHDCSKE